MTKKNIALVYRIYPNKKQQHLIDETFGCVRKVYNEMLNTQERLYEVSTRIANRYDAVCVETLNMRTMSNRGFKNGKATIDNGYGMFLRMLEYKLENRGKKLIRVDKWYPSSQLCSCCGYRNTEVRDLSIRKWICPKCGVHHDRDWNAALNIHDEGIRILKEMGYLKAAEDA